MMSSSVWGEIAAQVSTLLDCLPSTFRSQDQRMVSSASESRLAGAAQEWRPLLSASVDTGSLIYELNQLHCSEAAQNELLSLFQTSGTAVTSACAEGFETTMRDVAEAMAEDEIAIFRRIEEATRLKFNAIFYEELKRLADRILDEVRSARQRVGLGDAAHASPSSQSLQDIAFSAPSHSTGMFDDKVNYILFTAFNQFEHLTKGERLALAKRTGLSPKQVATWFANQRQRRTRRETTPGHEGEAQKAPAYFSMERFQPSVAHVPSSIPDSTSLSTKVFEMSVIYQPISASAIPGSSSSVDLLTDFAPGTLNRTPIASYDSDVSSRSYQIDSSDFSISSLDSKWSQDPPESYYGLPLPPTNDLLFSFELPPTDAVDHFDYSPDNSIWNADDSSFSSSSSSVDSYLDDYAFQLPMGAEDTTPLTCGLLTARQAKFAESPSSFGLSPLSTQEVEMDIDIASAFGQVSEFGVLPVTLDTSLTATSVQ